MTGGPQRRRRVLHNCWTCGFNVKVGGDNDCDEVSSDGARYRWANQQDMDDRDMPPRDADGCRGWKAKP